MVNLTVHFVYYFLGVMYFEFRIRVSVSIGGRVRVSFLVHLGFRGGSRVRFWLNWAPGTPGSQISQRQICNIHLLQVWLRNIIPVPLTVPGLGVVTFPTLAQAQGSSFAGQG